MIPQSVSGWLFSRPIKSLVVHLPTFLWLNIGFFFKVDRRVLLDASAWPLLCGYLGVEYKFLIFNSLQKFLYTWLSNCGPLSVTIDWGILNLHTMFLHTN